MQCYCDWGNGDDSEFFREDIITARVEHYCCECGDTIQPGSKYQRIKGVWDGKWETFKTCTPCATVRSDYFCSWTFGELGEMVWECLEVEL